MKSCEKGFSGFPPGKLPVVRIPELFFSELFPYIDNLPELKVTLYIFWLIEHQKNRAPYVSFEELESDPALLKALELGGTSSRENLRKGLERAVARGTFLLVKASVDGQEKEFYFLNSERGRQAAEKVSKGELQLEGLPKGKVTIMEARPNIFVLYEQNIGLVSPLIAQELMEAEATYPQGWIEEAFKIAVERNIRNWRYIKRILERWATEGKEDAKVKRPPEEDRYSFLRSKYSRFIKY